MRVILLNLPWEEKGRLGVRAGSRWPFTSLPEKDGRIHYIPFPFFLAHATSLLKKNDLEAGLIDAIAEGISGESFMEKVRSFNPSLAVIETSTPSFANDIDVIKNINQNLPECQIALCGPHATVFAEQILNQHDFIDYIFIGEYEYTLLDLVNSLENSLNLEPVLGLAYRENPKIRINAPRPAIDNLDSLPWPERETLSIYNYNDGFCDLPQPNVQMWTSRGCPFQCTFCLWPQALYREHRHRRRCPKDVADEMEYLIKKFDFKAIYFDDDVFNIDREHVLDICWEIKERQIKIPWAAMARADLMDEELLERMSSSGLYAIKYGIESASKDVLNSCKKNMNLEKAFRMIRYSKKLGIRVHLTFCLGLPEETRETIQETSRFILDSQPDSLQFSFATPFPGTEYFYYLEQAGLLFSKNWTDYDANHKSIIKTKDLSNQELEQIKTALAGD